MGNGTNGQTFITEGEDVTFFWCSSCAAAKRRMAANATTFHATSRATLARSGTAPTESRVHRFGRDDLDERRLGHRVLCFVLGGSAWTSWAGLEETKDWVGHRTTAN
jgi:hypothetical protein